MDYGLCLSSCWRQSDSIGVIGIELETAATGTAVSRNRIYLGRGLQVALCLAATLLLAACGPQPSRPPPSPHAAAAADARALEEQGQYEAAVDAYLSAAEQAQPPARASLVLEAVRLLIQQQQLERAQQLLSALDPNTLSPEDRVRASLLMARVAFAQGDLDEALRLSRSVDAQAPADLYAQALLLQAEIYDQRGNYVEAARSRILLSPMLTDLEAQERNREGIWASVAQLSPAALEQLGSASPPDELRGWLELAAIVKRSGLDLGALEQQLQGWRAQYPQHPAAGMFLEELTSRLEQTRTRPGTVALILPLQGQLAAAGSAIRDGFMAAYYADRDKEQATQAVRVYDSSGAAGDIWSLYQQALNDGAQAIVGPLDKQLVSTLASAGELQVPVLALNTTEQEHDSTATNLYQFGLPPEDEARQIAERAAAEGLDRAVALVPEGEWGTRIVNALQQRMQELGGTVLEYQSYDPSQTDFSAPIQQLLNLDRSEQRYQRLRQITRRDIQFEPRRRQDAQLVVIAAYPLQARLIAPQLRFFHAGDLPVYATSHVYTGVADADLNRDMDGVMFCDMPWELNPDGTAQRLHDQLQSQWPQAMQRFPRLFALGIDAYGVLPYLNWLREQPYERYAGVTGSLYLDERRRVHRVLQWARFVNGRATVIAGESLPAGAQASGPGLETIMEGDSVGTGPADPPGSGP